MRSVDEAALSGVPLATLVERAGTAVARIAQGMLGGTYGRRVVVVAGPGNNGADGRVAARLLAQRGARVVVHDAGDRPEEIAGANLVIDAAFGTGWRGEYRAPRCTAPGGTSVPVLAVDVPTGLDADTGHADAEGVVASATVTFGALKPGLLLGDGPERCGAVSVRAIGLPLEAVRPGIHLVGDSDVVALVPGRRQDDNKWSSSVMVVAGSPGMYGAPVFVAHAAARSGAGMVRLGVPGADSGSLPASEAVARTLPERDFDRDVIEEIDRFAALVVGPGLGRQPDTVAAVRRLVASCPIPTLVDADGLSALGDLDEAASVIAERRSDAPVVLTPHAGEFARLGGRDPEADRLAAVQDLARRTGAIVLLKGSTTVVADPAGQVLLAASGSSALATAGTGDVLSGVIGALIARGVRPFEAAAIGSHVHGRAASAGRREGLVAGDLPELVSDVLSRAAGEREGREERNTWGERDGREGREGRDG